MDKPKKNKLKVKDKNFRIAEYFNVATWNVSGISHKYRKLKDEMKSKERVFLLGVVCHTGHRRTDHQCNAELRKTCSD
jgi:uncharacterized NAD-dependent epimerase/dehydratase family protein